MLLEPELVAAVKRDPDLDDEARAHLLAAYLILREGGPLAERLTALPDDLAPRREFLRATLAWSAAEEDLAST